MQRISLLPLVCYAVLLGYACYAASVIGHWPYYAHPDPKEVPGLRFLEIAGLAILLGLLSLVVLPPGYVVYRAIASRKKQPLASPTKVMLFYCAGAAVWTLDLAAEFTRLPWYSITSWVLD